MKKTKIKLSIIMPVYNEEKTIMNILERVKNSKIKAEKEIVIVDDFSRDGTREILGSIKDKKIKIVFHETNKGKGSAIRTGLQHVTGDFIIIQDADLEYNPDEYHLLLDYALENSIKVVYGSRMLKKENKKSYWSFYLGNILVNRVANLLYWTKLTDVETCYKLVDRELINSLNLKAEKFDFEPEVTAKILKKGIEIKEIPISYSPRSIEEGKKIRWKDGVDAIWTLIKYRFGD